MLSISLSEYSFKVVNTYFSFSKELSVSSSGLPKSNILTCPLKFFFDKSVIESTIPSKEAISVLLVCSNSSNAPALIKLSIHFLFTPLSCILSQKSVKLVNGPFSLRSCTIKLVASNPTFFTLPKPKRIFPSSTVNLVSLWLISGFRTSMCILLHSSIYSGTLSKFPKKLFKVAAINSAG